jgi:peptidoglycan/xylan/chitin deacetylase (PgdA/CDA1 family)
MYSIMGAVGLDRVFASLNRGRPCVLAFHAVTGDERVHLCNYQGKHLYASRFARFMRYLATHYHPVHLGRIVEWLAGGPPPPEKAVAVTFDDGYRNVLTVAGPILSELSIPATLFVVTDFVLEGRMLWPDRLVSAIAISEQPRLIFESAGRRWDLPLGGDGERIAADRALRAWCKKLPDEERVVAVNAAVEALAVDESQLAGVWEDHRPLGPGELADLADVGIEVGSHTQSHGIVTRLTPAQAQRELSESRRLIEEATGRPCTAFSYPNGAPGDFDDRSREAVARAGYRCAVTTVKERVRPGTDAFEVPRYLLADNATTQAEFASEVSGLTDALRGFRDSVSGR